MPRQKKIHYAILTPRNDEAKKKLEYHGDKWIIKGWKDTVRFDSLNMGRWSVLVSRDGNKCLLVKEVEDKFFKMTTTTSY